MTRLKLFSFLLMFLFTAELKSQDFDELRTMNYTFGIQQIKDAMNYGFVFSGHQHRFTYRRTWKIKEKTLFYQGSFGVGPLTNKPGILGLNFLFKPIDVFYNIYDKPRTIHIAGGPWIKTEYNYQLYPELHSGYSFYYTNFTLGLALSAKYEKGNVYLRIRVKNSVAGLIARQALERDPYFFDLDMGSYFSDQHEGFRGCSFNMYNNTDVEFLYVNFKHPRIGYGYSFEYFSFSADPNVKAINHNFSLFFYPKS